MEHNYTVVWRPEHECEFRVDYVTLRDEVSQHAILLFAGYEYIVDITGETPASIYDEVITDIFDNPYDLIAIFEGHCTDVARF